MADHFAGGSLKLKGLDGAIKKKKKVKSEKSTSSKTHPPATTTTTTTTTAEAKSSSQSISESTADAGEQTHDKPRARRQKTAAELKFEEIQRQRQQDRIAKTAASSHKERVAEFNKYLEGLSEHYDIPKVGPG
ncbi:hypothetical protein HDU87_004339 [Geranomyces variabilis]|uniref:DUF1754-domain-containing protein n=1 Tax=Geranomyces variabilis TaxID=109894 RepID=A0AAD5TIP5_9FUNG|nr:hypothetical protein HDU87_004339 [Geranomyces variabilis]